MAWDDKEARYWRWGSDEVLFELFVFTVSHREDVVQCLVFRQDEFWEIRSGYLHFFDFVRVCLAFVKCAGIAI